MTRVSLVPAYRACEAPNRSHGPPLAFGSCAPPVSESNFLTVGTPDANGAPAKSLDYVEFTVQRGDPSTVADEVDLRIRTEITDVRCKGSFYACESGQNSDYTGELDGMVPLRITDRLTLPVPGQRPATVEDIWTFRWTVPCSITADFTVGATCASETTAEAIAPGSVPEGMRSIWELGRVEIRDAGVDDYTLFAVQGVFVP